MSTAPQHTYEPTSRTTQATTDAVPAESGAARRRFIGNKGGLLGRGWRKITWLLISWSTLIVVGSLITAGDASSRVTAECHGVDSVLGSGTCQELADAAFRDQFEHLMKIGVVGFVVLSLVWFMTRQKN